MALKELKLTESEQAELKDKLDAWKVAEKKKIEEDFTDKYEQMEAQLRDETETLVEEIKENMKKVYTKRFTKALKEMYEEIKAEVLAESRHTPEAKALEEVKAVVYPLMNEPAAKRHRNEFSKLASMYESLLKEFDLLKGQNKKGQLVASLSPEVRKVVDKLIGEGTEEQIVDKFTTIKQALKEEVATSSSSIKEDADFDLSDPEDDFMDREITIKRNAPEPRRPAPAPAKKPQVENKTVQDFQKMLNEQLVLSGIKKGKL